MKREIKFVPAPMSDGCTSELLFHVEGELGMVEFQLATNWYVGTVADRRLQEMKKDVWKGNKDFLLKHFWGGPQPLDVCYFSPVRISEDDSYWENGAIYHAPNIVPCYYGYKYRDSDGVRSIERAYETLIREGDEGLFKYLEDYYLEVFHELR